MERIRSSKPDLKFVNPIFREINRRLPVKYDLKKVKSKLRGLGISNLQEFCVLVSWPQLTEVRISASDTDLLSVFSERSRSYWIRLAKEARHIGSDLFVNTASPGPFVVIYREETLTRVIPLSHTSLVIVDNGDRFVIATLSAFLDEAYPELVDFMDCVR